MTVEIPQLLNALAEEYVGAMTAELPGFMSACYLHGSIALGAFQPGLSDIDFIAVISRPASEQVIARLKAIHGELKRKYPHLPMSGSYLQWHDLGRLEGAIEPHPHYHDGALHLQGYHDINLVTWWLLKNRGLALLGPAPGELDLEVDWDRLVADMRENLNTYWVRFTRQPSRIAWLLFDYGIQWTVLGVLRQFYTFREQDITSKTGAGEYALAPLPKKWHRIIQEALNVRGRRSTRLYRLRLVRAVEAFRFLRYTVRLCNAGLP